MSLWSSSPTSFLSACPTTMRTSLARLPSSPAGAGCTRMGRYPACCRRSQCLSSTTPSASPCIAQRATLSTYRTYSSVLAGRRAATTPAKVREATLLQFVTELWPWHLLNSLVHRWFRWPHGAATWVGQTFPAGRCHFLGHWLRGGQSTGRLYAHFRIPRLDQSDSAVLVFPS